ncbi:MAG: LysR substrate-binding domain-containing protein, partial [Armatimonadota bacterium]
MDSVDLHHLRTFLAVAEHGSFSRAAEALYVSQPAVSVLIKKMEAHYGTPLLDRLGKRVELTEAGHLLVDYARRLLALGQEAEDALGELKGLRTGRVLVAASTLPGTYLLPHAIGAFSSRYPDIAATLVVSHTQAALKRVVDNDVDFGVTGESENPPELEAVPYVDDELLLIVAPQHPLAEKSRVAVRDLKRYSFICRERGSGTREVIERALANKCPDRRVAMEFGSVDAVKQAVMAGLGVAIVSKHAVELEVCAGRLRTFRLPRLRLRR